jgi:hypothetical protein
MAFAYHTDDPVREDLADAHRRCWQHIAEAGTWLSGAERVAVAEETRRALECGLCRERKAALSPFSVEGEHDCAGTLPSAWVEMVHRITTDAARLTQKWHESVLADGMSVEQYVEALGVAVLVISVDEFHRAMGFAPEPLPQAQPGEPSRIRPAGVTMEDAWVPMVDLKHADAAEKELLGGPGGRSAYVIRALSLVPAEVRAWNDLSGAQYLDRERMMGMQTDRAIDRSQVELVAGRVSALNECFY